MPDRGLQKTECTSRSVTAGNESIGCRNEKTGCIRLYNTLDLFDKNLQNEFNLSNVLVQTDRQAGEKLMLLEGWVPTEKAQAMEEALGKG